MINTEIIHPEILKFLASAGHGSTVLIADGNFPIATGAPAGIPRVFLNFAPDLLGVPDVLEYIVKAVPIEAATAPVPDDGSEPPIFPQYRALLPKEIEINKVKRFGFYDAVNQPELGLIIATGEKRPYACILLTIGVRKF
jgi:L-fucose mutarotase